MIRLESFFHAQNLKHAEISSQLRKCMLKQLWKKEMWESGVKYSTMDEEMLTEKHDRTFVAHHRWLKN